MNKFQEELKKLINDEIKFSEEHRTEVTEDTATGYINGLKQVLGFMDLLAVKED